MPAEGAASNVPSPGAAPSAKVLKTPPKRRTYKAEQMRRRRLDPAIKERERLAELANDAALRMLVQAHKDEYMAWLQHERDKLGLPPFRPKGRRLTVAPSPAQPADRPVQNRCRHNQGLKKMPYGIFCATCGKKIR